MITWGERREGTGGGAEREEAGEKEDGGQKGDPKGGQKVGKGSKKEGGGQKVGTKQEPHSFFSVCPPCSFSHCRKEGRKADKKGEGQKGG
jgi:hypothetical protein